MYSSTRRMNIAVLVLIQARQKGVIRSAKQDDINGASNIILPCPGS
jgi:hypothetical protein